MTVGVSGGGNTVGAWVLLIIAILGWVGAWMEVVGREHVGHNQEGWPHSRRCQSTSCV